MSFFFSFLPSLSLTLYPLECPQSVRTSRRDTRNRRGYPFPEMLLAAFFLVCSLSDTTAAGFPTSQAKEAHWLQKGRPTPSLRPLFTYTHTNTHPATHTHTTHAPTTRPAPMLPHTDGQTHTHTHTNAPTHTPAEPCSPPAGPRSAGSIWLRSGRRPCTHSRPR